MSAATFRLPGPLAITVRRPGLAGLVTLSLEGSSSRMHRIGRSELTMGEIPSLDWVVEQVDAVTAADVARVIDRVLGAGSRTLAVVGPADAPSGIATTRPRGRPAEPMIVAAFGAPEAGATVCRVLGDPTGAGGQVDPLHTGLDPGSSGSRCRADRA
jgi:hypothetical protein